MPKIIDQAAEKVLKAARNALLEEDISRLSMRSIARDSGIAVGTIYHYFPSKIELIAAVMLEDWQKATEDMDRQLAVSTDLYDGIRIIDASIRSFSETYRNIWHQYASSGNDPDTVDQYHPLLVKQLENRLQKLITQYGCPEDLNLVPILAELILSASSGTHISTAQILFLTKRLFPERKG